MLSFGINMKFEVLKFVRILSHAHLKLAIGVILFLQLTAPSYAAGVTLAWDASTSENIVGYKVHYRKGRPGPPYDGNGANEGDSPIDVGNVTTRTISGLSDTAKYYFVVSATIPLKKKAATPIGFVSTAELKSNQSPSRRSSHLR